MPVFALRSSDFEEKSRVEEFRGAVATMCHLDISPDDRQSFSSSTVIGLAPDLVLGDTVHSACTAERTRTLAADTGDHILFHIPVAGGFAIGQAGGEDVECEVGSIYVDPSEVPGISRFVGERTEVFYVSIPRGLLVSAAAGLDKAERGNVAMTPQWRMFARYAVSLHAELAGLTPQGSRAMCRPPSGSCEHGAGRGSRRERDCRGAGRAG